MKNGTYSTYCIVSIVILVPHVYMYYHNTPWLSHTHNLSHDCTITIPHGYHTHNQNTLDIVRVYMSTQEAELRHGVAWVITKRWPTAKRHP